MNHLDQAAPSASLRADIIELAPDGSSLVCSFYDSPDYQDRFSIETRPGQYNSVDEVVTDWFTSQPAWLRIVSTNTLNKSKIENAITSGRYNKGQKIGSWEVVARNTEEIVFGQNMGFMDYRYSFRLSDGDPNRVEGATAVKFLWRRSGRFYFGLVRPFHRRFVKLLLTKTTT